MKNLNRSLPAALLSVLLSFMFGCGGHSATIASHTLPPPPITVEVSTTGSGVMQAGGTQQFTATVAHDSANLGVTWTVSCSTAPCGSVSPTSTASGVPTMYTAPSAPPSSDMYITVTATSVAQSTAFASNGTTVAAITISMAPASALIPAGSTQPFTATLRYDPGNQAVSWTLTQGRADCSPACGSLSLSRTLSGAPTNYSARTTMPDSPSVTVTATSGTDATKSATAAITLTSGTVQLAPNSMDFGLVPVTIRTSTQSATLTNTGTGVLNITSITLTGDNAGDFSQSNTCPFSLGAGLSCIITTAFKPTKEDVRTASIVIADSSADSPQQLSLSGTGKAGMRASMTAMRSALAGVGRVVVPIPTGPATVGTRLLRLTDAAREDPFLANGAKRELLVRFWYPAVLTQACELADYTSPKVWMYLSQLAGVHLPEVVTNSCVNAPMADGAHPVVVFTHGYTGTFTDYTFLFEDLASRGYVVASPAHTYETTAVEFADGSLVKSKLGSYLGSWRGDDATLAFVASVRVQDLKFLLNELGRLNAKGGDSFAGKLDDSRIAIAGHSLGGTTAFLALAEDPRFRAAIILDGYVPAGLVHPTQTPVLLLTAGQEKASTGRCRLWKNLSGSREYVNLSGAEHLAPSDAVWLARGAIETGSLGPERTVAVVREHVTSFLDSNLRERPLDASMNIPRSDHAGLTVVTEEQSPCREPWQ